MRKQFDISLRDAKRICDGLELAASWDKTEIYYELKQWIKENETKTVESAKTAQSDC